MKKKKMNRVGQKGNHNAHKHGFYASSLTPDETCLFLNTSIRSVLNRTLPFCASKYRLSFSRSPGLYLIP
jgi:hypothetical protein